LHYLKNIERNGSVTGTSVRWSSIKLKQIRIIGIALICIIVVVAVVMGIDAENLHSRKFCVWILAGQLVPYLKRVVFST